MFKKSPFIWIRKTGFYTLNNTVWAFLGFFLSLMTLGRGGTGGRGEGGAAGAAPLRGGRHRWFLLLLLQHLQRAGGTHS